MHTDTKPIAGEAALKRFAVDKQSYPFYTKPIAGEAALKHYREKEQ